MFITVDGEHLTRKVFRRAQDTIKIEAREGKIKEIIKNSDNNTFKRQIPQENIN